MFEIPAGANYRNKCLFRLAKMLLFSQHVIKVNVSVYPYRSLSVCLSVCLSLFQSASTYRASRLINLLILQCQCSFAGVAVRESFFCSAEPCPCSLDRKCSLFSLTCECPCTSPLDFRYCRSQFLNSRFVIQIHKLLEPGKLENKKLDWKKILFQDLKIHVPLM